MEKVKKPFYKKWWVWLIVIVIVIGIIGSNSDDDGEQEEAEDETEVSEQEETDNTDEVEEVNEETNEEHENISTEVELTLDAELSEDDIIFNGETNLPDGAMIAYEVWREEDYTQFEEGAVEIKDGRYEKSVSITEWRDGEIIIWLSIQTVLGTSTIKPDEILEVFGEMGENIKGDNVSESDVMNRVVLERSLLKDTGPEETLSQQNAVSMAQDYLAYTAFSRSGLIDQLEFEGFDNDDATYAVDKLNVDWKEQAVRMAQNYLDYTSFSRSGLIDQLIFEGFSNEDATYAVDEIGL